MTNESLRRSLARKRPPGWDDEPDFPAAGPEDFPVVQEAQRLAHDAIVQARLRTPLHALLTAIEPLTRRVRTDVTAVKDNGVQAWTRQPLTRERLLHHLNGGPARGVCPIRAGESVTMVAVLDFDSHKGEATWKQMAEAASAVADVLHRRGLRPTPFRSSGGLGAHLTMIWALPQDAYSVRMLLTECLAAAGFRNGTAGVLAGQVEIFPKQDSVPADGFGNQFVLPLAGKSVPLDPFDFSPLEKDPGNIVWQESAPVPVRKHPAREVVSFSPSGDHERLRRALAAIPNEGEKELDYDKWRNVIFAIGHAVGDGTDEHRALAHEFSARSGKYDPDFLDNRVLPYTRSRDGGVSEGTIYAMASELGGWVDSAGPEDFPVVDEAERASRFVFHPACEFASGEEPEWIVKDVLPRAGLAVIYGESGSGKTFATLDLAAAVARGVDWRGRKVRRCRVAYVVAEGAGGFRKRLRAYAKNNGLDVADLDLWVLGAAPNLLSKSDAADLIASVKALGNVGAVVIDTLAQVTPGANENAGEDMGRAVATCRAIHEATGALVILVHHSGKDASKGARGWSGLRAAADAEIEVVRGDTGRVMRLRKQKDGEDGKEFGFQLEVVQLGVDGDGDPITSCVVVDGEPPKVVCARPLGKQQQVINEVIQEFAKDSRQISVTDVVTEAASRLPPGGGKRDKRGEHALRGVRALCTGPNALYRLSGDEAWIDIP